MHSRRKRRLQFPKRDSCDTAVRLPNGDEVHPGGRIAAGGGFHDATGLGWYVSDSDAIEHIERCVAASPSEGVYVIQHPVELLD